MDIFDGLLALILMLLHWRIALCTVASLCVAMGLTMAVSWVSGLQGFLLVAIGFFAGVGWEDAVRRAKSAKPSPPEPPLPRWAMPSLAFVAGTTLGMASWTSRGAMVFGAVLLAMAYVGWFVYQDGKAESPGLRMNLASAALGIVSYAGALVWSLDKFPQ